MEPRLCTLSGGMSKQGPLRIVCASLRSTTSVQGYPEEVYGCEFLDMSMGAMHLASCSGEKVYLWDIATACQLDSAGPPSDIRHEPAGSQLLCRNFYSRTKPDVLLRIICNPRHALHATEGMRRSACV